MAQRILSFQSHLFLLYYCWKPFLILFVCCTLFVIKEAPKSHILCWYCTLCCNVRDWTQGFTHASRYSFYHKFTFPESDTFYAGHWVNHCRILLVILSPLGDLTIFNDLIFKCSFSFISFHSANMCFTRHCASPSGGWMMNMSDTVFALTWPKD